MVDQIRLEAVDMISAVQLRKFAENKSKHAAVKIVLEFFPHPSSGDAVSQSPRRREAPSADAASRIHRSLRVAGRDRGARRARSRAAARRHVTYYLRNLIYLLHRIARESEKTIGREFEALTKASAPGNIIYVIKEAATALGLIKTDAAVKLLTTRLAEFEATLLRNDTSSYPVGEMQKLLDRIISALARIGTSSALLTIARHGMKANPMLGDTRARLAALAQHDLSFDEGTVAVLLKASARRNPWKAPRPSPAEEAGFDGSSDRVAFRNAPDETEALFRDIAHRFPDQESAARLRKCWQSGRRQGRRREPNRRR